MSQQKRYHTLEIQNIDLKNIELQGDVLDIGGGGEGIIGQTLENKVVAIDKLKGELEEAPEGPLKLVMDAKELKFLDNSFDNATSFFTFMYIKKEDYKVVFKEIYRVLRSDGKFKMWDTIIPKYKGGGKDIFLVPLEIDMGNKVITTTYGVLWPGREQNIDTFIKQEKI